MVMEKTGTTVVEDGWEGFVDKFGNLILQRLKERESEAEPPEKRLIVPPCPFI